MPPVICEAAVTAICPEIEPLLKLNADTTVPTALPPALKEESSALPIKFSVKLRPCSELTKNMREVG